MRTSEVEEELEEFPLTNGAFVGTGRGALALAVPRRVRVCGGGGGVARATRGYPDQNQASGFRVQDTDSQSSESLARVLRPRRSRAESRLAVRSCQETLNTRR
jgi:hypothetical protein